MFLDDVSIRILLGGCCCSPSVDFILAASVSNDVYTPAALVSTDGCVDPKHRPSGSFTMRADDGGNAAVPSCCCVSSIVPIGAVMVQGCLRAS